MSGATDANGAVAEHRLEAEVQERIRSIRRDEDGPRAWEAFQALVEENIDEIATRFTTRWLVSICDTYADHADPVAARNALLVGVLVKMEKVAQTYAHWRLGYPDSLAVDPAQPHRKIRLWDGMASFHLDIGDATNTMFGRMTAAVAETPVVARILATVLERLRDGDTILAALDVRHRHVFATDFGWILDDEYEPYRSSGRIPAHRYERFRPAADPASDEDHATHGTGTLPPNS